MAAPLVGEDEEWQPLTGILEDVTDQRITALDGETARRLKFERDLLTGIDDEQLFVQYQPVWSLTQDRYIGAEALVRWRHPERGELHPGSFIGVAEETGLIVPLGSFVVRRACQELRRWQEAGIAQDFTMSINVSAAQFRTPGFVETLAKAIEEAGLAGSSVLLEVTESLLVEGGLDEEILEALRRQGVRIAIDDFGTKYSALNYLTRLKVDALKVDESFVRAIDKDAGRTVVTAIAALGRGRTPCDGRRCRDAGPTRVRESHRLRCRSGLLHRPSHERRGLPRSSAQTPSTLSRGAATRTSTGTFSPVRLAT